MSGRSLSVLRGPTRLDSVKDGGANAPAMTRATFHPALLSGLGVALGVVALLALLIAHASFVHDDAFISLRYARNLALHGELSWNVGERVEGYTNFLHVILTAGLVRLGFDPLDGARLINLVSALGLIFAVAAGARRLAPRTPAAWIAAPALAGMTPGVAIWVMGGLETVLVAALIGWGTIALLRVLDDGAYRPALAGGLIFGAAVLTRMDAAVFIAGAGVSALLFAPGPLSRRLSLAALLAFTPALFAFAHMGWRMIYYGPPFPLTFYAKTGLPLSIRLEFLSDATAYTLAGLPALILALPVGVFASLQGARVASALLLPVAAQLIYILWSGGDHMPGARVMLPLAAPAILLLLTLRSFPLSPVLGALALTGVIITSAPRLQTDRAAYVGTAVGWYLSELPDGQVISLATAGSTPYFANEHVFIDQLGLNDPVIAHRDPVPIRTPAQRLAGHGKGDGAYILSREPDIVILGPAEGTTVDRPWFLSDVEMAEDPGFQDCYERRIAEVGHSEPGQRRMDVTFPLTFTYYERTCPKSSK